MKKINLEQWESATIEQRAEWLRDGTELDETSRQVLGWASAFKRRLGHISSDTMVAVYRDVKAGYIVNA